MCRKTVARLAPFDSLRDSLAQHEDTNTCNTDYTFQVLAVQHVASAKIAAASGSSRSNPNSARLLPTCSLYSILYFEQVDDINHSFSGGHWGTLRALPCQSCLYLWRCEQVENVMMRRMKAGQAVSNLKTFVQTLTT